MTRPQPLDDDAARYTHVSPLLEGARLLPCDAQDLDARRMGWRHGLKRPLAWQSAFGESSLRLLGSLSEAMVAAYLERFGVLAAVARAARLSPTDTLHVTLSGSAGRPQTVWLWSRADTPLMELVLRPEYVLPIAHDGTPQGAGLGWPSLYMDRLVLEMPPSDHFSQAKGHWPLPGQRRPGLGLCEEVLAVVLRWAAQIGASVVTQIPEHFHGGVVFSRAFAYVGPVMRGWLDAACARLLGRPMPAAARLAAPNPRQVARRRRRLARTSWAFEWGLVRDHHNQPLLWPTELQARTLDPALRLFHEAPLKGPPFHIDHTALQRRWLNLLASACQDRSPAATP